MNSAYIRLTKPLAERESFTIFLTLNGEMRFTVQRTDKAESVPVFVDPDTVAECITVCKWFIAYFPGHTEQVERILASFFTLAYDCTGNGAFMAILRDLGKQEAEV